MYSKSQKTSFLADILFISLIICITISCTNTGSDKSGNNTKQSTDGKAVSFDKVECYCIILGGGKTTEDAKIVCDLYKKYKFPLSVKETYPLIVNSETIEGLNAGFQIAVLGFCKDEKQAAGIRDIVNSIFEKQAYIKKVNYQLDKAASPIIETAEKITDNTETIFTIPVSESSSPVRWKLEKLQVNTDTEPSTDSYILFVEYDNMILAKKEFTGISRKGEGEEDLGESKEWEFEKIKIGNRNLILVKSKHYEYDEGEIKHELYAFQDNQVKNVATIYAGKEFYGPPQKCHIIDQETQSDWKQFVILCDENETPVYKNYLEWNSDELIYKLVRTEDI